MGDRKDEGKPEAAKETPASSSRGKSRRRPVPPRRNLRSLRSQTEGSRPGPSLDAYVQVERVPSTTRPSSAKSKIDFTSKAQCELLMMEEGKGDSKREAPKSGDAVKDESPSPVPASPSSLTSSSLTSASPQPGTSRDVAGTRPSFKEPKASTSVAFSDTDTDVDSPTAAANTVVRYDVLERKHQNAYKAMKRCERQLEAAKAVYAIINAELVSYKEKLGFDRNVAKIEHMKANIESEWTEPEFPWSETVKSVLKDTFKLTEFRPKQLAAINVTMSKKDMLLVMPTGGGKSLVYQLPAVIEKDFTLVVSPLISLIQDQLMGLKKLGIPAVAIHSGVEKDHARNIIEQISKLKKTNFKFLYVTPECLAKNKSFLGHLLKAYNAGILARVAIDEVHCCSSWGHDFRPDYKFLGIVRQQMPNVPFVGLTATASTKVLTDVQQMLNMEECEIITAPFNRPNLFYEVIRKPAKDELIEYFVELLDEKYMHQSGIIYTNTINETVALTKALRDRGMRVGAYHAQMENDSRISVQEKWMKGTYQAIIATIAFGMGIDKPNVRFVIHATPPKSMESLYQESGRAGRDGKRADCLLLFRLKDYLKIVGMASSLIEENKSAGVLEYCLEQGKCRRLLLSQNFEETWDASHCTQMCDHCKLDPKSLVFYDLTRAGMHIQEILTKAVVNEERLTLSKLIDAWYQVGCVRNRVASMPVPTIKREFAEIVIAFLLMRNYLTVVKNYTAYSTIIYLVVGAPITGTERVEMCSSYRARGLPRRHSHHDSDGVVEPPEKRIKTEK